MTVGCDGGARAQAGVLHRDGRTPTNCQKPRPNRVYRAPGNTHRVLNLIADHGPCSSLLHRLVPKLVWAADGAGVAR
jgi:hypothetical protein